MEDIWPLLQAMIFTMFTVLVVGITAVTIALVHAEKQTPVKTIALDAKDFHLTPDGQLDLIDHIEVRGGCSGTLSRGFVRLKPVAHPPDPAHAIDPRNWIIQDQVMTNAGPLIGITPADILTTGSGSIAVAPETNNDRVTYTYEWLIPTPTTLTPGWWRYAEIYGAPPCGVFRGWLPVQVTKTLGPWILIDPAGKTSGYVPGGPLDLSGK